MSDQEDSKPRDLVAELRARRAVLFPQPGGTTGEVNTSAKTASPPETPADEQEPKDEQHKRRRDLAKRMETMRADRDKIAEERTATLQTKKREHAKRQEEREHKHKAEAAKLIEESRRNGKKKAPKDAPDPSVAAPVEAPVDAGGSDPKTSPEAG